MNEENERMMDMPGNATVPLEPSTDGPMFQNAGGVGRKVSADIVSVNPPLPSENSSQSVGQPEIDPTIPVIQVNPIVELKPISLSDGPDFEHEEEYEELETYETHPQTELDLDLIKRNTSGLRFVIIFGLIILLFILLLPFLITII